MLFIHRSDETSGLLVSTGHAWEFCIDPVEFVSEGVEVIDIPLDTEGAGLVKMRDALFQLYDCAGSSTFVFILSDILLKSNSIENYPPETTVGT